VARSREMAAFSVPADGDPETAAIRGEQLAALRQGLAALPERERDALALRFAAGLRSAEVGLILGLSAGATRMLLSRSLLKLKDVFARATSSTGAEQDEADSLDRAIDDVLARRSASIPDPLLERVVRLMASLNEAPVPPHLEKIVRACLQCGSTTPQEPGADARRSVVARTSSRAWSALRTVTAPACVICAAGPGVVAPLTAAGLVVPAFIFHASAFLLAPLNLLFLWKGFRAHHEWRALAVAVAGVVLILVHMTSHVVGTDNTLGTFMLNVLILGGTSLLAVGWFIDRQALRRRFLELTMSPA